MKKGCFFILLLLCVLTLSACAGGFDDTEYAIISEDNVSEDGFIYSVYENKTAAITGIKTPDAIVTVPEKVGGYTVVEIASEAFRDDGMLQLLTLTKTVEKVSESAFSGCSELIKADLGGGVKKIEASAFYDCEYLCDIVFIENFSRCHIHQQCAFSRHIEVHPLGRQRPQQQRQHHKKTNPSTHSHPSKA